MSDAENYPLLYSVDTPRQLRLMTVDQLPDLAEELRRFLIEVTSRTELFEMGRYYISRPGSRGYDVGADGRRFLMVRNAEAAGPEESEAPEATLILVKNWLTEVARMLGEGR